MTLNRQDDKPHGEPDQLFHAIEVGDLDEVRKIVDAAPLLLSSRNADRDTPLHKAAFYGDVSILHLLLARGASVNATDASGGTALHVAAQRAQRTAVELLLERNSDANVQDNEGRTPLHAIASHDLYVPGNFQVASLLVAKGAELNTKTKDGVTPMAQQMKLWPEKQDELMMLLLAGTGNSVAQQIVAKRSDMARLLKHLERQEPTPEQTKAAAIQVLSTQATNVVRSTRGADFSELAGRMAFNLVASRIGDQFSASRKLKPGEAWWPNGVSYLEHAGDWVCLLSANDKSFEPNSDLYFAAALLSAELPADVVRPLYVRFFQDSQLPANSEQRGDHALNALGLMWPNRLPSVEGLWLDNFRPTTLAAISNFTTLKALSLAGCQTIRDFSQLGKLHQLESLRLDHTLVDNISWISALPRLKTLSLIGCAEVGRNAMHILAEAYQGGALKNLRSIRLADSGIDNIDKALVEEGSPAAIFKIFDRKPNSG